MDVRLVRMSAVPAWKAGGDRRARRRTPVSLEGGKESRARRVPVGCTDYKNGFRKRSMRQATLPISRFTEPKQGWRYGFWKRLSCSNRETDDSSGNPVHGGLVHQLHLWIAFDGQGLAGSRHNERLRPGRDAPSKVRHLPRAGFYGSHSYGGQ